MVLEGLRVSVRRLTRPDRAVEGAAVGEALEVLPEQQRGVRHVRRMEVPVAVPPCLQVVPLSSLCHRVERVFERLEVGGVHPRHRHAGRYGTEQDPLGGDCLEVVEVELRDPGPPVALGDDQALFLEEPERFPQRRPFGERGVPGGAGESESMSELIGVLFAGLLFGAFLGLMAFGFTIAFTVSQVFNFAVGQFAILAGLRALPLPRPRATSPPAPSRARPPSPCSSPCSSAVARSPGVRWSGLAHTAP